MDDTDRQLIGLLRNDARATVASLAKALGVARGTVQNRMGRLAANGTIVGYTVRLKPDVEEPRMRAFMTVAVEGSKVDAVLNVLRAEESFTDWPVERELRFSHVVHYQIFDEYRLQAPARHGTRTNIGEVVARIIPDEI